MARGWDCDNPGSGRVDVTMESWQKLRHSTPEPTPPNHQSWWLKLEIKTHCNSKVVSKNLLSFQIDCNKYLDLADEEGLCVPLVQTGNIGS